MPSACCATAHRSDFACGDRTDWPVSKFTVVVALTLYWSMSPIRPRSASVAALCSANRWSVPLRIIEAVRRSLLLRSIWLATSPPSHWRVSTDTGRPLSSASAPSLSRFRPRKPPLDLIVVASAMVMTVLLPSAVVTCIRSPLRAEMMPSTFGPSAICAISGGAAPVTSKDPSLSGASCACTATAVLTEPASIASNNNRFDFMETARITLLLHSEPPPRVPAALFCT